MTDRFDSETVRRYLTSSGVSVTVFDEVDSTNRIALELADGGAPEGTAIVAASQTAGRGRLGRSFYSPTGSGIYISVILRPAALPEKAVLLTPAAGVAVCRAIEGMTSEKAAVKWVNDIYMHDRKVCGILVQSKAESGRLAHAVVGIGVNLIPPVGGFPEGISDVAGSVFTSPLPEMRSRLTAAIIDNVASLCRLPVKSEVMEEYRSRSWLDGCDVNVIRGESSVPAKVVGIDGECRLEVLYECGGRDFLSAGEVSVRKAKK